ncbi:hypothetical protein HJG60_011524 [Phyllostomus discolor]|uniref:Uncharacterized protein n=1 Tax=Phyllostomus discolor TaxID=89673 RepID=A0A833ZMW7_9CHIR|nr:hypothetical protein HJG60_011524 [Phyllostomus discolor]
MHGSTEVYLITESANHNQFKEYSGMLLLCSVAEKNLCSSLALPFSGPTIPWLRCPQSPFRVSVFTDDIYIVNQMKAQLDEERILTISSSGGCSWAVRVLDTGLHGACLKANLSISPSLHTCMQDYTASEGG